jgi:preprotein translocase subunit SecY
LNQSNWCDFDEFIYTFGLVIYLALLVFFAYFYTSVTFNPMEVANNLKKQGGFVPGIRPGRPTTEYLTKVNEANKAALGLLLLHLSQSSRQKRLTRLLLQL